MEHNYFFVLLFPSERSNLVNTSLLVNEQGQCNARKVRVPTAYEGHLFKVICNLQYKSPSVHTSGGSQNNKVSTFLRRGGVDYPRDQVLPYLSPLLNNHVSHALTSGQ